MKKILLTTLLILGISTVAYAQYPGVFQTYQYPAGNGTFLLQATSSPTFQYATVGYLNATTTTATSTFAGPITGTSFTGSGVSGNVIISNAAQTSTTTLNAATSTFGGVVSVSTTSPYAKFTVVGTQASQVLSVFQSSPAQTADELDFQDSNGSLESYVDSAGNVNATTLYVTNLGDKSAGLAHSKIVMGGSNNSITLNTSNVDRMFINNQGSVGIATSTPWGQLVVSYPYGASSTEAFTVASSTSSTNSTGDTLLSVSSTGVLTLPKLTGTQCLHEISGVVSGTGSDCGSGGGGSAGGTWSTTTSNVAGELVNYSNNNTDIVSVGSNSTTSDFMYADPNASLVNINGTASSSKIRIAAGSLSSPSLLFNNNSNTGFYGVSAGNIINATISGTQVLSWTSTTMNLGSTGQILFPSGTVGAPGGSIGNSSNSGIYAPYFRAFGIASNGITTFQSDTASTSIPVGNFGIGTTSPYAALSVVGASGVVANQYIATSTIATSTLSGLLMVGANIATPNSLVGIKPQIASQVALQITGAVGQTGDLVDFNTADNNPTSYVDHNGFLNADTVYFTTLGDKSGGAAHSKIVSGGSNNSLTFNTSNIDRMLINAQGAVGIATSTPWGQLAISYPFGASSTVAFDIASSTSSTNSTGNNILTALSNGNVGIGTTSPYADLSVQSGSKTATIFSISTTTTRDILKFDANGHKITGGITPTCGAGCSSVIGDDQTFRIITGTGVTSVTVNFANTYTNTPVCVGTDESGGTTVSDGSSTPSTVVLNLSASLTTKSIGVICQISENFQY